jgi:predicted CXXCH cytochrome family protein
MRNMTRDATTATIRAPFDGATLRVGDDVCTMAQERGARFMQIATPHGTTRYRITKVVGGRYREDFVGVDVTGAADPTRAPGDGREHVLPATFVFATRSWRYKGYSVMVKERPAMSAKGLWARECIACHNTLPYLSTLYDDLYGPTLPSYQGKVADRTLPPTVSWKVELRDDAALARALRDEVGFLGGTLPDPASSRDLLAAAARATARGLDGTKLVELGIGCEACHNGSRGHVAEPTTRPTFRLRSAAVTATPPPGRDGADAPWINRICARCHTVLFTRYPWTWEGQRRASAHPGGSSISSGEGRDFQLGACASRLACTGCHDPHAADAPAALARMATPAGNPTCTRCHPAYADGAALARHSHHRPDGPGGSCVACHMAKKNMGLDYALVRYHRIGSPTDHARVELDRPLECALCHADRGVEDLVATMERWWGKRYDRAKLRALYGDDLGVDVMRATLARGKAHEQAVAIVVLGEARAADAVPALVPHLAHEYPLIRFFAQRALETITGRRIEIDLNQRAADIAAQAAAWRAGRPPASTPTTVAPTPPTSPPPSAPAAGDVDLDDE